MWNLSIWNLSPPRAGSSASIKNLWQKSGEKVREKWGDGKTAKKGGQSDAVWGCTAFGAIMRGLRHLLQMEKWIVGDYGRFSRHDLGHFPREGRCHLYAILLRWDSAIYFHYDVKHPSNPSKHQSTGGSHAVHLATCQNVSPFFRCSLSSSSND